jgi:DNA-binding transcriptional LysR family regulator
MNETLDVLSSVKWLLAAARTGSATRAAEQLGTTTATVLRRLEAVEEMLGTRLFDRLPTGLRATTALALARPWAEQAEAAAAGLLRELTGLETTPAGTVRLAAPPAVATLFVVPQLPRLLGKFPDISLEVAPATALVDLTLREADLAIRTVRPERGELVSQRLAPIRLGIFRSPKLKAPPSAALVDYPWLAWDASLAHLPEARWLATAVPAARVVLRSTDLATLIAAAQHAIGLVILPTVVAEHAGGLVALEHAPPAELEGSLWLVAHAALRPVARVAAVWDWVIGGFKEQRNPRSSSEGRPPRSK